MTAKVETGARLGALDAWRGVCAMAVVLLHVQLQNPLTENRFVSNGTRFVDFFFVLSGFVIAYAYRGRLQDRPGAARDFAVRRVARLWPLHLVVLTAFVAFELFVALVSRLGVATGRPAFSEDTALSGLLPSVFLVQAWGFMSTDAWNGPAWSISCEIVAYAVFALICVAAPRILDWVAVALVGLSASLLVLVAPEGMQSTYDFGMARCFLGFFLGVLAQRLTQRWAVRPGTACEVGVVVLVGLGVTFVPRDGWGVLVTPMFAASVVVFAGESGIVSHLLRRRAFQRLGEWSYSIYMVHAFISVGLLAVALVVTKAGVPLFAEVDGVSFIVGNVAVTTGVLLLYVGVVLVVSRWTYRHVEVPCRQLAHRYLARRARQEPGGVSSRRAGT